MTTGTRVSTMSTKQEEFMLTTIDNPFDPFENYDEWFAFDNSHGHHTCGYIARIATSSDELSSTDESLAISRAVDEIVELNVTGLYLKVTRESIKARLSSL